MAYSKYSPGFFQSAARHFFYSLHFLGWIALLWGSLLIFPLSAYGQIQIEKSDPLQNMTLSTQDTLGLDLSEIPPSQLTPEAIKRGNVFLENQFKQKSIKEPPKKTMTEHSVLLSSARPQEPQGKKQQGRNRLTGNDLAQTRELKKNVSPFESYLLEALPSNIPLKIAPFGYDLFHRSPTSFVPLDAVPVGPDYLLGPGDELRITVWGKINADISESLDRDGKIVLPQLGALHLSGLTFTEAKTFIKKEFSRYYKLTEVKINISMGQLRTIPVFVVGKVQRPGTYTLSSFSTLINALFASGGPSEVGTLRDIQVKRQGKTISHFDLYDLLLKGDKGQDIRMMAGDVIFVPTVGPRIGITGNVKVPAVYEAKDTLNLRELITMAGGINATAYLQQVQIERVSGKRDKIVLDLNLEDFGNQGDLNLKDGDLVKIFSIAPGIKNGVTLKGNVVRPGIFEWHPGMRFRSLIKGLEDLLPETFLDYALIERLVPPDGHKEIFSVALEKLLVQKDEKEDLLLQSGDTIVVFNQSDFLEKKVVRIHGAVNQPGDYAHRVNMKLSDLFKLAGGLKRPEHPESYLPDGIVIRKMLPDFHDEKISFNFIKAILKQESSADILLHPFDEVYLFDQSNLSQKKRVQVVGAVQKPGRFLWAKNMRINDLIHLAEGTQYYAFLESAELTRIAPSAKGPLMERITINLEKALAGDVESNILLSPDDYLSIRSVPEWQLYRTVQIEGEVRFPGLYTSKKGERLSSLIERAGGLTRDAYLKGAVFTRKSVQKLQQQQLDDSIDRFEQQMLSKSALTIEGALSPDAALQHKAAVAQRRALIQKMRAAKAIGRMSIYLSGLETFRGSASDVLLEEGDVLHIPEQPEQVQVIGSVFNQTAFIFDEKSTVSDYIDKAGGITDLADEENLYILKIDGTAVSRHQKKGFWAKNLIASTLDPGDTIVVPEDIEKIAWLRETKDMTQILYQIAVAAGVLLVAF